jgi:hypothetical protein
MRTCTSSSAAAAAAASAAFAAAAFAFAAANASAAADEEGCVSFPAIEPSAAGGAASAAGTTLLPRLPASTPLPSTSTPLYRPRMYCDTILSPSLWYCRSCLR